MIGGFVPYVGNTGAIYRGVKDLEGRRNISLEGRDLLREVRNNDADIGIRKVIGCENKEQLQKIRIYI
jgi:hypothetical protein